MVTAVLSVVLAWQGALPVLCQHDNSSIIELLMNLMPAIQCTGSAEIFSPCLFRVSQYYYPQYTLCLNVKVRMAKGGLMSHAALW